MKNRYLIIKKGGEIVDPDKYLDSKDCSEEFKAFIQKEVRRNVAALIDNNKKSDYLKYAHKMGFDWEDNADIGFISYDYKANFIKRLIEEYARQLVNQIGFPIYEIRGSNFFDMSYPVVQAYAMLYGDRLFKFKSSKKDLVMSYDSSYPQFNLASKYQLSHKDLPFAHFSIADCYRYEQSGECMLFYRQRRFFMPDLHPYFRDVPEAFEWYPKIEKQIVEGSRAVNREYFVVAEVGSEKNWKKYKKDIIRIAKNGKRDILVNILMDKVDRYWIINVDYKIIDQLGQSREIGCIQIDVGNAKRLNINYLDSDNKKKHPVIIHSAVPGGIERYLYMIFDEFKKCFPLWLHPIQIRLVPVSRKYVNFCKVFVELEKVSAVRIDIDDRPESVSKRIKRAREELIPYVIVIGEEEIKGKGNINELKKSIKEIEEKSKNKPFLSMPWPKLVSKQIR